MKYKVLILEDNEMDASLMEQHLQRSEYNYSVKWVADGEAYERAVRDFKPDVIISDYRLRQYSGKDAIHYKNMECEEVPLIIVSGTIGEEKAVELIKNGATDFLIKNNISSRLAQTVMRALKESLEREKRRKVELKLKSSEEHLRMLFEHSLDGIIIGNPESEEGVISVNTSAAKMLGYTADELKGRAFKDFYDLNMEHTAKKIEEWERTGFFQGELNMKRRDGSLLPVEASSRIIKLKDGEFRSYWIIRDISERKKYELDLKKEKEFTDKALNSLPGIFYVMDENQKYLRINENVEKELGYSWEEMQQMKPMELYFEEERERISKGMDRVFSEGQSSTIARLKKKDGTSGHYFLTGAHFEQDGQDYILGTAIDVSEQVEAQRKVEESLREKETLLAEIHHRVKNNLAVISGMMQLQVFNSDNEELNTRILNSVSRIKSIALIHEHLYQCDSLSHIEMGSNLQELFNKIRETFGFDTEITCNFDLQKVTLNVNQAVPLALIFNEIITNIHKHAFTEKTEGKICISLKEEEDMITLTVKDNGAGFPEELNLKDAETMGLTLINTLSKQLSGKAEFYSDEATTFRLTFKKSNKSGSSSALGSRRKG